MLYNECLVTFFVSNDMLLAKFAGDRVKFVGNFPSAVSALPNYPSR